MKPLDDNERKRIRKQHEYAIGAQFVEWLEKCGGPVFSLTEYPGETSDLVCKNGERILNIEHTSAQYDKDHRVFIDTPVLGSRHPQDVWPSDPLTPVGNRDEKLLAFIEGAILKKCKKAKKEESSWYGSDPILLIEILPGLTAAEELERLLFNKNFQTDWPFDGVYVVGRFPQTRLRPGVCGQPMLGGLGVSRDSPGVSALCLPSKSCRLGSTSSRPHSISGPHRTRFLASHSWPHPVRS
jgi:hypothetical protein